MQTREVPRDQWKSFFDGFSRQHEGWIVTLELLAADIGDQDESTRLPLVGISADVKGENRIEISVGGRRDAHLTHIINDPKQVWITERDDGIHDALEVESGDGRRTIVSFRRVAPVQTERQLPSA
jgi:hypothetical protein